MNPLDAAHISRLRKALKHSRKKLEPFRRNRVESLKQYVGRWYSDDGSDKKIPINLIELGIQIYARHLSARTPRVLAKTRHMALKPRAAKFQLALNHLLEEIDFRKTMNIAVKNALFSIGIVKVGLNASRTVEIGGFLHDIGQPFASCVDLDDFVFDTCSKDWEQIGFAGNKYRMPLEKARNIDLYDKAVRESLQATHKSDIDEDPADAGKASEISTGEEKKYSDDGEYQDYVEVEDIWLPDENLVITLPREEKYTKPLQVVEWDGPEAGPYRLLAYNDVPDNIMPLPPVALWRDLHDLSNQVFRKLANQSNRQKDITAYSSANKDDAKRIQSAKDGDMVQVNDANGVKTLKYGGIDSQQLMFGLQLRDLFSYLGGNLDSIGGLSAQAETLGQEQLLAASSSKRINDMQDQTVAFTKSICKDLGQYLWTDPLIEVPIVHRLSTGREFQDTFGPADREGDFYQYNLDVEPYSMQDRGPQQRLQAIRSLVQELLIPLMPALQEQGIQVNMEGILRCYAELADMPELEEFVTFSNPTMAAQAGPVQPPPKPAVTTRNYVRTNRPGATTRGKLNGMMQTLAGNAQAAETEGAMRPVS